MYMSAFYFCIKEKLSIVFTTKGKRQDAYLCIVVVRLLIIYLRKSLHAFTKHERTHLCVANGQRETTSVLIVVIDSVKAVTSSSLSFSFSSRLSLIVRVNVVLNTTVVVDSD